MKHPFHERDLVVYQKPKHSLHPGPRAHDVRPAALGDSYDYVVDKFWVVVAARDDGRLVLRTPGGKLHEVDRGDPNLRRPTLRERAWLALRNRDRLRALREPRL